MKEKLKNLDKSDLITIIAVILLPFPLSLGLLAYQVYRKREKNNETGRMDNTKETK